MRLATRILQGDCLDTLKTLPDDSVHCCVTSPPYFGLRDYGTAKWEGGDKNCKHKNFASVPKGTSDSHSPDQQSRQGMLKPYRNICGKCDARRIDSQIGLEPTPEEYVARLVEVFCEVRRVLRDDGTCWLNLGDSFSDKNLIGIPWRVAFALQADGWYLRQEIIWHKPNPMPESVKDRCTKAHEQLFLLSKRDRYYFDAEAIAEPSVRPGDRQTFGGAKARNGEIAPGDPRYRNGSEQWGRDHVQSDIRNRRSVWTVATNPYSEAHFATFPPKLIEPCILAGCPVGGTVLDPFAGSGTTGMVALQHNRGAILCELNPEYVKLIQKRISNLQPALAM